MRLNKTDKNTQKMMLNLDPRKSLLGGKLLFSCERSRILILATLQGQGAGLELWSRAGGGEGGSWHRSRIFIFESSSQLKDLESK